MLIFQYMNLKNNHIMKKWSKIFNRAILIFVLLTIWQILGWTSVINTAFLTTPLEIANRFYDYSFISLLLIDTFTSLQTLLIGFLFGYILVHGLILVFFLIPKSLFIFKTIHTFFKYIPLPVLIPISILFFGLGSKSILFLTIMGIFVFLGQHILQIISSELKIRETMLETWQISKLKIWFYFIFKPSNVLIFNISTQLILWLVGIVIFAEILLGGEYGLGVRILEFQQLYLPASLFSYVFVIIVLSVFLEKILNLSLAWKGLSKIRILALSLISVLLSISIIAYSISITGNLFKTENQKILTYTAGINLPIFVYEEKYDELDLDLEFVTNGLQIMDSLLAGNKSIGGMVEYPNSISGINQNNNLKIALQAVETPKNPNLFLLSKIQITENDWSNLNNQNITYYPNNAIVKQGVMFTLNQKGVDTTTINLTSSANPTNLNQSFLNNSSNAIITIEPFATELENQTGVKKHNTNSLITIINYKNLPLASFVIDTNKFNIEKIDKLNKGLNESLQFIKQNTNEDGLATGELVDILVKYNLPKNMSISRWQMADSVSIDDANSMLNFVKLLGGQSTGKNLPIKEYYLD